jgi:hypothetical protein
MADDEPSWFGVVLKVTKLPKKQPFIQICLRSLDSSYRPGCLGSMVKNCGCRRVFVQSNIREGEEMNPTGKQNPASGFLCRQKEKVGSIIMA